MKIKQTTNTKVGGRGNNLKLKARSLKRQVISRFQLLIIYINFMKKTNKKAGDGERKNMNTRHPYIWIPDVDRLVGKKILGMFGGSTSKHIAIIIVAVVGLVGFSHGVRGDMLYLTLRHPVEG